MRSGDRKGYAGKPFKRKRVVDPEGRGEEKRTLPIEMGAGIIRPV
jgi:hypothetical protein